MTSAVIILGIFSAGFLTLGIIQSVKHYRLTHVMPAAAEVAEHIIREVSRSGNGRVSYARLLKLKYHVSKSKRI